MSESKMSNQLADKILGDSRERLYEEGYQRGMKYCHDKGLEEYFVPFFTEGFVQGCAEEMLISRCEYAVKEKIPLSEIAKSYQITEEELKDVYSALVSERSAKENKHQVESDI